MDNNILNESKTRMGEILNSLKGLKQLAEFSIGDTLEISGVSNESNLKSQILRQYMSLHGLDNLVDVLNFFKTPSQSKTHSKK